ncbi:uncharacterized protein TRIADDRAFT_30248, partial [Trichoplax adhaerens]
KVMFTGFIDEDGEKTIKSLGGQVVDNIQECTHLVTDKIRRTVKFLCGLSRGIPIVNTKWLDACKSAKTFVPSAAYFIKDRVAERQNNFLIRQAHDNAKEKPLLENYEVYVTPNVRPPPEQMKMIVECAGGHYLSKMPTNPNNNVLIISCDEDEDVCFDAVKNCMTVHSAELLLSGVLRQALDTDNNILWPKDMLPVVAGKKRSRSTAKAAIATPPSRASKRRKT